MMDMDMDMDTIRANGTTHLGSTVPITVAPITVSAATTFITATTTVTNHRRW
jgi:hypothetical protein